MNRYFHFFVILESVTSQVLTSTAQASGWMVQRFAVKEFHYLTCAAWYALYAEGSHLMMYFVWVAEAAIGRLPVPQY